MEEIKQREERWLPAGNGNGAAMLNTRIHGIVIA